MPRSFLIILLTISTLSTLAQRSDELKNRIVWTLQEESNSNSTIVLAQGNEVKFDDSPLLRALRRGAQHIIRLADGDTILLVTIPRLTDLSEFQSISRIIAVRLLIDDSESEPTYIDESNISHNIFREAFMKTLMQQEIPPNYVSQIDFELVSINPDKLRVTLTGGEYGDATLIYTPASATPEIIIHE